MTLNPIKSVRRRRRLRRAIEDEVFYLRRHHGEGAHAAALEKLKRPDLTSWGRKIVQGAAKQALISDHATNRQPVRRAHSRPGLLNPIKLVRHDRRLRRAIAEEVFHLQRVHGRGAHDAALEKLRRPDLTNWGRQIVQGAVKETEAGAVRKRAQQAVRKAWRKPMIVDPIALISRRSRLRRAITEEVAYLRRVHGQAARIAAFEKLGRADLTQWGREIVLGAAKQFNS